MAYGERYTSTGLAQRTKTVTLTVKRDELLYDIKNYAYVEGDVMEAKTEHDRHQVQDIGEEGNIDRVTRVLDLAHAESVEALYPYSKEEVDETTTDDDTLEETAEYTINLLVPDKMSKTTVNLLMQYIHEYMVCRVLADWTSITKPSAAATWQSKCDEALERMKEAVNFRVGRVRRTQTPF